MTPKGRHVAPQIVKFDVEELIIAGSGMGVGQKSCKF